MSSVEKNSVVSFHAEKKLLKYYQKVDSVKAGVSVSNPVNQTENKEDLKKLLDKIYNNQNSSSNNTAKDVWTDIGAIIEGEKKKLESKVDTSPPVNPVAEEPVQAKPNVKLSDEVQKKIVDAPVTIHSGSDNPLNIGSGVIVADTKDNNGKTYVYVLSNYHVEEGVEPGKQTFVGFKQEDGSIKQLPAELVASRDKFNNEDLVMYRVEVPDGTDYTVTEIAKKEAEVGDILYSSGFPGVNQKSFLTPKHTDNVDVIASENKNIPNKPELHPKLSVPSNIVQDDKRTDVIVIDGDQNGTGEIIQVVSKLEVLDTSENLDIRGADPGTNNSDLIVTKGNTAPGNSGGAILNENGELTSVLNSGGPVAKVDGRILDERSTNGVNIVKHKGTIANIIQGDKQNLSA